MDERTLKRFMAKVRMLDNGCWKFTSRPNKGGYCEFTIAKRSFRVHRLAYEHFVGPIPKGMTIDHECHNADLSCKAGPACPHRRCCNPAHLSACPIGVNTRRSANSTASIHAAKEKCSKGHDLVQRKRQRACQVCETDALRERYATDPEFRARRLASAKAYQARQRAARRAAKAAATS